MIRASARDNCPPVGAVGTAESDEESAAPLLSKLDPKEDAWAARALHTLRIVALAGIFMLVGPMLIMTNAYLLKSADFPYPMTLCAIGGTFKLHLATPSIVHEEPMAPYI